MFAVAGRALGGGVASTAFRTAVRSKHIQGIPCRNPMPFGEKVVHVTFMITGILSIPAYVTFNLKHWGSK